MSTILVVNAGSSSIKYRLIDLGDDAVVCSGLVQRIGEEGARAEHTYKGTTTERDVPVDDHQAGLQQVMAMFDEIGPQLADVDLVAVGHRVVMGGGGIDGPVLVTDELVAEVDALSPLAPLHNPPNLAAIAVARELLPDVPQVAVFDTAFFHDLPAAATTYAIDRSVADAHAVRRYGFHGISHEYVSARAAEVVGRPLGDLRQIVLHLGNGASASAVVGGRPVDTSMGMTPLEGLVMGTRGGDVDPGALLHLARTGGLTVEDIDDLLNHRSGMKGLTGHTDMRDVHRRVAAGDASARLALDVYVRRLKKYVGAYAAVMGGLDVLTFTAGVGENDPITRAAACDGLGLLGVAIDAARNVADTEGPRVISPDGAPVTVLVVPTDEELAIAHQTAKLL